MNRNMSSVHFALSRILKEREDVETKELEDRGSQGREGGEEHGKEREVGDDDDEEANTVEDGREEDDEEEYSDDYEADDHKDGDYQDDEDEISEEDD